LIKAEEAGPSTAITPDRHVPDGRPRRIRMAAATRVSHECPLWIHHFWIRLRSMPQERTRESFGMSGL
jgi:hypothetical protein